MTAAATGPLASRWWDAVLSRTSLRQKIDVQARITRGRALVKSGRVRDLTVTPSLASAVVTDGDDRHVSVRVSDFDNRNWESIIGVLTDDLSGITALFEGTIPQHVLDRLTAARIHLMPRGDQVDGDCDCGDHIYPCAHTAAVHQLIGALIDADPLSLIVLRGRSREDLLAALRGAWATGDAPVAPRRAAPTYPSDRWASPRPLPALSFDFTPPDHPGVGLRALGPMPGDADLLRALTPIYEAGGNAALALALADSTSAGATVVLPPLDRGAPKAKGRAASTSAPPAPLTERLMDALALVDGSSAVDIARHIDAPVDAVRKELIELEALGIVVRHGTARATRWWVG